MVLSTGCIRSGKTFLRALALDEMKPAVAAQSLTVFALFHMIALNYISRLMAI
jgi:hypothetical protein